jgi:hypothetical protein
MAYTPNLYGKAAATIQPSTSLAVALAKQAYYGNYNLWPGYGGGGGSTPAPTPTPTPPQQPASPTSTISDLTVLVASIPIAQDGQVISAEYHNSLRAALIALTNRLGLGLVSEENTITNAPRLTPVTGTTAWDQDIGVAKKPSTAGDRSGWMEIDLPDGARIKKMQVFAATDSDNGTMKVRLQRRSVSNTSANDDLISLDITNNDASTAKEADVTLPTSTFGGSTIEEARLVDNRKYKYVFVAELNGGKDGKNASINAIQVVLGQ